MSAPLTVVIGHDYREQEAYDVCEFSLRRHSTGPLNIIRLQERDLRAEGLYDRPYRVDEKGQFWDERDGRPFSTAFSFARFLTPHVARAHGVTSGFVLFIDCDFLFRRDVAELFKLADSRYAVQVVKHQHAPPPGTKMDGVSQHRYSRKNWSSCILWNLDRPALNALTPSLANHATGGFLHGFEWLEEGHIGYLPETWNWLVGHSPTTARQRDLSANAHSAGALHYTDGGPWFKHMQDCPMAKEWLQERRLMRSAHRQLELMHCGDG